MVVIDETYEDGSEYFEWDDGSFEYYSAEGNLINSYYASAHQQGSDHTGGILQTIGDTLVGIFGGGQRGYYPPRAGQQASPYSGYPRSGVSVSPQTGLNISPWVLAVGGLIVGSFLFGKRGR